MRSPSKPKRLNIMIIGKPCIGKSSLVNTLCCNAIFQPDKPYFASNLVSARVPLLDESQKVEIQTSNDRQISLKFVVVRDYQCTINNIDSILKVVKYLEQQLMRQLTWELELERVMAPVDQKIHACLYMIPPGSRTLSQSDVDAIKRLHPLVNVIPVIAKGDTMTPDELRSVKSRIKADLQRHQIPVFEVWEGRSEASAGPEKDVLDIPLSFISSDNNDGAWMSRSYPWGTVWVDDASDTNLLRQVLFETHLDLLLSYTDDVIYEAFRYRELVSRLARKPADASNI